MPTSTNSCSEPKKLIQFRFKDDAGLYLDPPWFDGGGRRGAAVVPVTPPCTRKTDQKDCEWLAQLLQYGLLRGSFVPPQEIRELRELTRCRVKLLGQRRRHSHIGWPRSAVAVNFSSSSLPTPRCSSADTCFWRGERVTSPRAKESDQESNSNAAPARERSFMKCANSLSREYASVSFQK